MARAIELRPLLSPHLHDESRPKETERPSQNGRISDDRGGSTITLNFIPAVPCLGDDRSAYGIWELGAGRGLRRE